MVGKVDIGNLALQMLGAAPIVSFSDSSNNARQINLCYQATVYKELRIHRWKFAILRANLPALATPPVNGIYGLAYQLPPDNLRVLNVGDQDPGQDISDYRFRTVAEYSIENGLILTNYAAPLAIRYVTNSIGEGDWDPSFVDAVAARIAWRICESITQSVEKRKLAMTEYQTAIKEAIRANALESAPEFRDDDSWMSARIA